MIYMVVLVATIVLIDLSGKYLTDKIMPLIYISSDEDEAASSNIDMGVGMSAEDLASQAQDHIFGGGKNGKEK